MQKTLNYRPLFDEACLAKRVKELGAQISSDFSGQELICVGVLKGAAIFMADLVRCITVPMHCEYIGVASYAGTESTGHVRLTHDLASDISGKNVLLIEDIIDTGHTVDYLIDTLKVREPKSLKIAALLSKPEAHQMHHDIDYIGFEISKEFVIGYGLDLDQYYRNLPFIAQVI